jgi:hypothetical protein
MLPALMVSCLKDNERPLMEVTVLGEDWVGNLTVLGRN